jgi:NAD(P)-dependent dehydrogenase (short-subunit alcohol dehydrogenase family)
VDARHALVTGAGGALAAAVTSALHAVGWATTLFGSPRRLRRALAPEHDVVSVDLADEAATRRAVADAEARSGGFDAVINVAGGYARVAAPDVDLAIVRAQLDQNYVSAVTTTTAALPGMLRRGGGTVVGIAAAAAVDGAAGASPYAASKAALVAYLRSLDHELAPLGVRSLVIYPMGTLDTAANRDTMPGADPATWIAPATLAQALVAALTLPTGGRVTELRVWPDVARQVAS